MSWVQIADITGPVGAGGSYYVHTQTIPATIWVVDHNLNSLVGVQLILPNGELAYTDTVHGTPNQTTLTFPQPTAGKAVFYS